MAERTKVSHPLFARFYARLAAKSERRGIAEHRDEMLAGLTGRVIEVGAGTGLNFRHYPDGVSKVVAVEPEPRLRRIAAAEAERTDLPIEVVDAIADDLPAADASFDAGIASLVLCSVPDQSGALGELHRVIRPDGELRFLEHVRAQSSSFARFQGAVDLIHPLLGGGCHVDRDTLHEIGRADFTVEEVRRFRFTPCLIDQAVAPHVVGRARRSG